MRRVIVFLIVAAIVLAASWFIAGLPGAVSINVAGYSIETGAPVGILLFIVAVLIILLIARVISRLVAVPGGVKRSRERRRRVVGERSINRALVALAAGEKSAARNQTRRARRLLGETPQTLLLSAEAERLAGDEAAASGYYKMLADRDDAAFLGLRGLFRQAIAREDWPEAALLAKRAEAVRPGTTWLREERAMLAARTGQWMHAALLAGPDAPVAAYTTAAAEDAAAHDPGDAMRLAKEAWRDHPGFAPAALIYARLLRQAEMEHRAQAVIRAAWKEQPVADLAEFLLAPIDDKLARIREATRMVGYNRELPESHFLLAQLYLAADLLPDARMHAEAARSKGMNQRRLWLLFSELELKEKGDTEAGRTAQRDMLQAKWRPVCPSCQTPGRITWGSPRFLPATLGTATISPSKPVVEQAKVVDGAPGKRITTAH
jgi:HemY protein